MIFYLISLAIGIKAIETRQTINHNWKAVSKLSINLPAIHGTVNALIPKHWEYKAIAEPWYLIGEDFMMAYDADGKNIHREIVKGMKAMSINKYPSFKKFEKDNRVKPISNESKHSLNLKDELLFFKI